MSDSPYPGNRAITFDWLHRQLKRLTQFTCSPPVHFSQDFIEKEIALFSLTDEITAQQSLLSSLTASIVRAKAKNFEAKARLNRQAFAEDLKRNTYEILLAGKSSETPSDVWTVTEGPAGRKVVTLARSPWTQELIDQWRAYLFDEGERRSQVREDLAKMIEEDEKVRKEEQELRESNKVSVKDLMRIEVYTEKLKQATDSYLETRYRLTQVRKIQEASVRIVQERTAALLAEIHKHADQKRIHAEKERKNQKILENKLNAAEDLELGRLTAKIDALEALCDKERTMIKKDRDDFIHRKETAKRFCKALLEACDDHEFKQVQVVVKEIRAVIRKLEDTANRVRLATRNHLLPFRE